MSRCNPWSLVAWMAVGCCLSAQFPLAASFLPNEGTLSTRRFLSSTSTAECETATTSNASQQASSWLHKGLILSSFTDGLKTNPPAVDWLMNALVETLWKEEQGHTQDALQASNLASPCNGPDPFLLGQLEATDKVVEELTTKSSDWKAQLALLCDTQQARRLSDENDQCSHVDLRVLYIPTAMYALRPSSTSKPGKQRGRNRADGKKRRNELMGLLEGELADFWETHNNDNSSHGGFTVRTVTLDWDDASVKQPDQVVVGSTETESKNDSSWVPESGKDAIRDWKPHLVYVQGGNTFWLHHCMEKGDWEQDLVDACGCFGNNDNDGDESSFSAVYCGVSAGAILAGESMQTACWKEWDDPSVVPGKETYKDWKDTKGLDASGKTSWFPHMTQEWQELTEEKTKTLLESTTTSSSSTVICVRDDQAFGIDGKTQSITELR